MIARLLHYFRPAHHPATRPPPFKTFTAQARAAMALAQDEARHLGHDYLGTEHLLLGLLREGDGVAGRALTHLEVSELSAEGLERPFLAAQQA